MTPLTYTFSDLQEGFKLQSPASLRSKLRQLEAAGFPPRLPGAPPRWSKPAVDQWLCNWGQPPHQPAPAAQATAVDQLRATMARAYAIPTGRARPFPA